MIVAALPLVSSALSIACALAIGAAASAGADHASRLHGGRQRRLQLRPCRRSRADAVQKPQDRGGGFGRSGIEGKAWRRRSVVQAVMSAQESLQTALAVRDKSVVGLPGHHQDVDLNPAGRAPLRPGIRNRVTQRARSGPDGRTGHRDPLNASPRDRRNRHVGPADQYRGDRQQPRQYQHHRIQRWQGGVQRSALRGRERLQGVSSRGNDNTVVPEGAQLGLGVRTRGHPQLARRKATLTNTGNIPSIWRIQGQGLVPDRRDPTATRSIPGRAPSTPMRPASL